MIMPEWQVVMGDAFSTISLFQAQTIATALTHGRGFKRSKYDLGDRRKRAGAA
jgi:hypothetical protein